MSQRSNFDADRPVRLVQTCFTGDGMNVLKPGEYRLDQVPDVAFAIGIVLQDPLPQPAPSPSPSSMQANKPRKAETEPS